MQGYKYTCYKYKFAKASYLQCFFGFQSSTDYLTDVSLISLSAAEPLRLTQ